MSGSSCPIGQVFSVHLLFLLSTQKYYFPVVNGQVLVSSPANLGKAVFTSVNCRCANSFAKRGEKKKCPKTFGHRQDCSNQGKWNDIARKKKFPSGQKRCIYVSTEISFTSQRMFENGTASFRLTYQMGPLLEVAALSENFPPARKRCIMFQPKFPEIWA